MTQKILIPSIAAALLATVQPAPVAGQPGPDRVAQAADGDASIEAKRAKVRQRIRALRAWRLTEALELDEATAGKLFPILNRYDGKLAEVSKEGAKLRRQMRQLVRKGGSNGQYDKLIDQMLAQQKRLWALQEQRFRDVRKVLTPKQAAKIMVLLPEIDRRIQQQIRQAMRKARQSGKAGKAGKADKAGKGGKRDRAGKRRRGPAPGVSDPF